LLFYKSSGRRCFDQHLRPSLFRAVAFIPGCRAVAIFEDQAFGSPPVPGVADPSLLFGYSFSFFERPSKKAVMKYFITA